MAKRAISDRRRGSVSHTIRIPADHEPHAYTIMAWAVHRREWGAEVDMVERELDHVVRTIAEHEPVKLLTPATLAPATRTRRFGPNVEVVPAPVDDIWMRDIAPVFAHRGAGIVALDLNFNGWDGSRPPRPGDRLARIFDFGVPVTSVPIVAEGGAFVTDGRGLAITTRSCLMSRNPHLDEIAIEEAMGRVGLKRLVWLAGDRNEPITSGHIDGYVAFLPSGGLAIEAIECGKGARIRNQDILALKDAFQDNAFRVNTLSVRPVFNIDAWPMYLNWLVTGRSIVAAGSPDLGLNRAAEAQLGAFFPGREVRLLNIPTIARGGGGVRCLTQPVPAKSVARPAGRRR